MIHCRDCGQPITKATKQLKRGYINQCDSCSIDDVEKHIGRRDDKHGDVEIFRENTEFIKRQIKRENVVGFNANLPFDVADRDMEPKEKEED